MARQRLTGTLTSKTFAYIVEETYRRSWNEYAAVGDLAPTLVAVDGRGVVTTLPIVRPEDFLPDSASARQRLSDIASVAVIFVGRLFYLRRPELAIEPDETPDGPREPLDRIDIIVSIGAWPQGGVGAHRCAEIVAHDGRTDLLDVDAPEKIVEDVGRMLVELLAQPAAA